MIDVEMASRLPIPVPGDAVEIAPAVFEKAPRPVDVGSIKRPEAAGVLGAVSLVRYQSSS